MPARACLSCFPYPTIPEAERPWRRNRPMGDAVFKDECRQWDTNEVT